MVALAQASQFLERYAASDDCAWMAERGASVVGAVLLRRIGERTAELMLLHVDSQARGIGIGRRLIAEAIAFAKHAGYDAVQLEMYDVMKTARLLFHAAGFRHVSEVADQRFGRTLVRQLWRLPLRDEAAST